jgi:FkbM family methyltransferase
MDNALASINLRAELTKLKLTGLLPSVSWRDLMDFWRLPCSLWPAQSLAIPQPSLHGDDIVVFDTPIGSIGWTEIFRQFLGILVLDQLRGVYDRGDARLRPNDVVVDLGAHVGVFTRYALHRGAGRVIAFEPEPFHFQCLKRGFADEISAGRVHLINAAAWNTRTVLNFHSEGVLSHVNEGGKGVSVQATTVDEALRDLGVRHVDFIKADIEGAERVALEGCREIIGRDAPRMALCTYHLPDDPKVIPAVVQSILPYSVGFNLGRTQAYFNAA